jgi:hypothetical protein
MGEIRVSNVHISAFKPVGFPYFGMGYHTPSRGIVGYKTASWAGGSLDTKRLPGKGIM